MSCCVKKMLKKNILNYEYWWPRELGSANDLWGLFGWELTNTAVAVARNC